MKHQVEIRDGVVVEKPRIFFWHGEWALARKWHRVGQYRAFSPDISARTIRELSAMAWMLAWAPSHAPKPWWKFW